VLVVPPPPGVGAGHLCVREMFVPLLHGICFCALHRIYVEPEAAANSNTVTPNPAQLVIADSDRTSCT
jgi:hypothetical protein